MDRDGAADNSHLTDYEPIVCSLAQHAGSLAAPVLLPNGDSHAYRSDNPLRQSTRRAFTNSASWSLCVIGTTRGDGERRVAPLP